MFCTNCGQAIEEGAKFCAMCGTAQTSIPAAAPVSARNQQKTGTVFRVFAIIAPVLFLLYILVDFFGYEYALNPDFPVEGQVSRPPMVWLGAFLLYGFSIAYYVVLYRFAFAHRKRWLKVLSIVTLLFCLISLGYSFGIMPDGVLPNLSNAPYYDQQAIYFILYLAFAFIVSSFVLILSQRNK